MDYGRGIIFKDVNLDIEKGESVFLIGNSGCGKSTLLRCMNGLAKPTSGEVYFSGQRVSPDNDDIDSIRCHMGMVYQHFNLFSHLNVLENIVLAPMMVLKRSKADAISEAKKLLERVAMSGRENAMPSELSGGQKQRIAIARTLAMHPDVILFDEPTSALDPTMVEEVENVISSLCEEGMTCVIVTHDMSFARKSASRVIFMAENGIYEQGTPAAVLDNPKKLLTRRFLYHSRMFEALLDKENMDILTLNSQMKKFLSKFKYTQTQYEVISSICDEFLYPIMYNKKNDIDTIGVRLMCSESSTAHTILLSVPQAKSDPLEWPYTDPISLKLLDHYTNVILSKESNDTGYEIYIQM
jgi:ABC-type polar amino acid transport system ATPase subunit